MKRKNRKKIFINIRCIGVVMVICTLLSVLFIQPMLGMDRVQAASYVVAGEYDGIGSDTIANCVAFARYKVPSLPGGLYNLQDKKNIINSHTPVAGAIAITRGNSSAGHVAYVESVSGANVVTLNGGFSGSGLTGHIVRITGTESEQGILGYWYPTGNTPQGCLDSMGGGAGTVHVGGWVFDRDSVNTAVSLHVYIGGESGTPGAECHIITANKERSDVGSSYPGVGNYHGFDEVILTQKRGNQPVYIYAINIGGGNNVVIGQGTVTISETKEHEPQGAIDHVSGGSGIVNVKGWVLDKDNVNASVSLHIYIGGEAGTPGAECHIIMADKENSSAGNAYPGAGNYHGFDETLQTNKLGSQDVFIYAINVGAGTVNPLLGGGKVTITKPVTVPEPTPDNYPSQTLPPVPAGENTPVPVPIESSSPSSDSYIPGSGFRPQETQIIPEILVVPGTDINSGTTQQTITIPVVQGLSLKNQKGRKVKCSWKKVSSADYYNIQIALNRSFTKGKKSIKVYGTKYTRYSLKKKKTYYVRVRAYKYIVGHGYVPGNWSTVKKVKIKK